MNFFRVTLRIFVFVAVVGLGAVSQEPTFNVQSNVVLVPTLVRDAKGNVVYGLQDSDFLIEDDGAEQTPHLDEAAEAEPVSLTIIVQRGRRAWREFDRMRGLPSMLEPVLSLPNTETALIFFDSKLELVRDFTNNSEFIKAYLKKLEYSDN